MLNIDLIPTDPDEALLYIGALMSSSFSDLFDEEGEFDESNYAYLSTIQRTVAIAAKRSTFVNRDEYANISREIAFKLENSQLTE